MPPKLKWLNCFPNEVLQSWRRPCSQIRSWERETSISRDPLAALWLQGLLFDECFSWGNL